MTAMILDTPRPVQAEWRITKARVRDGRMEWVATTTQFKRDVQKDKVTRAFYQDAIRRFKSGTVQSPFFSVAHYGAPDACECGYVYKALTEYACPQCKAERDLAGVTENIWIDGDQPKASGYFFDNDLGRATFEAAQADVKKSVPEEDRIRISMGFYPDPNGGTQYTPAGRNFIAGWIEHFAATRVPVVPETDLAVVEKSMQIKTKFQDGASIVGQDRATRLAKSETRRVKKSGVEPELVVKAHDRMCPQCKSAVPADQVDCPECGKMIGLATKSEPAVVLPEEMTEEKSVQSKEAKDKGAPAPSEETLDKDASKIKQVPGEVFGEEGGENAEELGELEEGDADIVTPLKSEVWDALEKHMPDSICPKCGVKDAVQTHVSKGKHKCENCGHEYAPHEMSEKALFNEKDLLAKADKAMRKDVGETDNYESDEEEATETHESEDEMGRMHEGMMGKKKGKRVEAEPTMEMRKSEVDDPILQEAYDALEIVQKALVAPGGDKSELLAHAANLVSAIRDYAHYVADTPAPAEDNASMTGTAVKTGDEMANPAVTTGQQVGPNMAPVPEQAVQERPQISEAQEEATESPEEEADETPADEQEEGRLHFVKQPNNAAKEAADQPPAPVKPKKKAPEPAVKSAAMHPVEAYLVRWAKGLAPQVIAAESRVQKREVVQKSLLVFRDGILNVINATTPTTAEDIEQVVTDQVSKALEAQQQEYGSQIAALEAQVKSLMTAIVQGEIEGMPRRGGRKSFGADIAKKPMAKSQPSGQEVLAGDTQVKTGYSASEVAQASMSQNPLFRY